MTRFLDVFEGATIPRWLIAIVTIVAVGTTGYVMLGWPLDDALYMTVITMTTVGFKEVRDLDGIGRLWTMTMLVAGVTVLFLSIGIAVEAILSAKVSGRREAGLMAERVKALTGHLILCGYGRVGATVARELAHAGERFVVIDTNPESLSVAAHDGHAIVEGDATRDDVLLAAGVERARGLITTIDSDAHNVYVTLSARALNPTLLVVARANDVGAETKLSLAGAHRIVSPYTRAGRQIAELAIRPRVADFIDTALSHGELAFSLEEIEIAENGSLAGRTVGSLRDDGIFALAIVRGERDYEPNPPPERRLIQGENLIVSGSAETLRTLRESA